MKKTPPQIDQTPRKQRVSASPPEWLSPYAGQVWIETVKFLNADGRPLHQLNTQCLIGFCEASATVRKAGEILDAEGWTIDGGREGMKKNPAVSMRIAALQALKAYCAELGLTPASSAKLPPKPPLEKPNRFAGF